MNILFFDLRDSEQEYFRKNKFGDMDITFFKEAVSDNIKLSDEEYEETDVISIHQNSVLTEKFLKKFHNLRMVALRSNIANNVDTEYCTAHKIAVIHIEEFGAEASAEYVLGLLIMLVRNILPSAIDIKNKNIDYGVYEGKNLKNYVLGIIGCNKSGIRLAKMLKNSGLKILVHSYMKNPELCDCEFVSFDELLNKSDVISFHTPYTGDNKHLLAQKEFDKMKSGSYVINIADGNLIDTKALYENITNGKIRGAAIDTLECELNDKNCENLIWQDKLINLKNVIVTPHLSVNTADVSEQVLTELFHSIKDFYKGLYVNRLC